MEEERVKLENGLTAVFRQTDGAEYEPCQCGGQLVRRTETSYTSAAELGRPSGAKGRDECSVYLECQLCGRRVDVGDQPHILVWKVILEDDYYNVLAVAQHATDKGIALKDAISFYDQLVEEGMVGDC